MKNKDRLRSTRTKVVHSFHDLVTTPFSDGVNALCWQRALPDGFREIAEQLAGSEGVTTLEDSVLRSLPLGPLGVRAVDVMLEDQRLLREAGHCPVVESVSRYPRDDADAVVATDVYSFHADRAPVPTATFLCTYHGPPSEGLPNHQAQRRVDHPDIRASLLRLFGQDDDDGFRQFLREHSYDLHYVALSDAQPFSFGVGNLWRVAVEFPGSPVPPCIHRAPATEPGQLPRLLLIS